MRRRKFDDLVVDLGREFGRRGMREHLASLRAFWRRRRQEQRRRARQDWDVELVLEWFCLVRIPPFDNVIPVLPRGAPCPECGAKSERAAPSTFVLAAFEGGWFEECRQCQSCWLHEREVVGRQPSECGSGATSPAGMASRNSPNSR